MSDQNTPKTIIITATILPAKNGKRRIIVTGAPEGELPAVYTGAFGDLHSLIDQVWVAVNTRKPMTVKAGEPSTRKGTQAPVQDTPESNPAPDDSEMAAARREMVEGLASKLDRTGDATTDPARIEGDGEDTPMDDPHPEDKITFAGEQVEEV